MDGFGEQGLACFMLHYPSAPDPQNFVYPQLENRLTEIQFFARGSPSLSPIRHNE